MATAILHNRIIRVSGGGIPDYSFDGTHTVIDDGSTSGVWKIALTSSGTLTIGKYAKNVTIQAQGGGGGSGAGYASGSGSDGADGNIDSYEGALATGTYTVKIGAAGSKGNDSAGGAGGTSSFGDIVSAAGGAGGAYKGGKTLTHSGLYSTYGQGGKGGTSSQYTGSTTSRSYLKGTYAIYADADPDSSIIGYMTSGTKYYVSNTVKRGTDGKSWWVLDVGGYVPWTSTSSAYSETVSDTRKWYGNPGNPGIVIMSGKA